MSKTQQLIQIAVGLRGGELSEEFNRNIKEATKPFIKLSDIDLSEEVSWGDVLENEDQINKINNTSQEQLDTLATETTALVKKECARLDEVYMTEHADDIIDDRMYPAITWKQAREIMGHHFAMTFGDRELLAHGETRDDLHNALVKKKVQGPVISGVMRTPYADSFSIRAMGIWAAKENTPPENNGGMA